MVVRVKVLLEAGSVSLESSAILNSGYEAEVPEVAIPFPFISLN